MADNTMAVGEEEAVVDNYHKEEVMEDNGHDAVAVAVDNNHNKVVDVDDDHDTKVDDDHDAEVGDDHNAEVAVVDRICYNHNVDSDTRNHNYYLELVLIEQIDFQ